MSVHERQKKEAVTCLTVTMSVYIYAYSRDRKQTQLPVIQAQCRYSNARETRERRSYLSRGQSVSVSVQERQEKDAVTCHTVTMSVLGGSVKLVCTSECPL